jgi:hypothetical protein
MLFNGIDPMQFYKYRHAEMLDEARRHRLLKEASGAAWRNPSLVSKALGILGHRLVEVGERLEQRYSMAPRSGLYLKNHEIGE